MIASSINLFVVLLLSASALAKAIAPSRTVVSRRQETPIGPAEPQSTDCYDIIAYAEQGSVNSNFSSRSILTLVQVPRFFGRTKYSTA
jgi:hypothetical protein